MYRRIFIQTVGITSVAGSVAATTTTANQDKNDDTSDIEIILHGGVGSPPDEPTPRQDVLDEAADDGVGQETPLEAVVNALCVLE